MVTAFVGAGCAYYLILLAAVRSFLARRSAPEPAGRDGDPPCSVLKPLAGDEPGLKENLRSFFRLEDPLPELLFAAREASDPALTLARSLASEHPGVRATVLAAGEAPFPNRKVHSLAAMTAAASGEVLVVSDSDVRVEPAALRELLREFRDPRVGVVTCPYRAVAGASPWSVLEALGMNTEFWGGVLTAQYLHPMDFAVGPTMAVRRSCLEAVGGWAAFGEHLAEDFQIGRCARQAGYDVRLAARPVEHRIGSQGFRANLRHRLRWRRSTRRSRPAGYWGEVLANPLPWSLLLPWAASGAAWSWMLTGACVALRLTAALAVGRAVLGDSRLHRRLWLLPLQDTLSLALWIAGLFGTRITWRGGSYSLTRDGRLRGLEDEDQAASSS